ncbi:MAG: hypothetical protein HUU15_02150 [Candidatus Brocadiae bacterium]|nr:hypothetical protein [Candidatus Brocadiia bacterium]
MKGFLAMVLAAVATAGCASPRVSLTVVVPAKTRVVGVRGIAVGGFKAENLDVWAADAHGAAWNRREFPRSELAAISDGVKNDLLNSLAETPFYSIVDIEGMDRIYDMDGLAGLVGKPTFKPGAVDALLFGRCWVGYLEVSGDRHETTNLEHWDYRGQQAKLVTSREELVVSDTRSASAVLIVQYTAIRIQPRLEILFVTTTIQSLRQDEGGGVVIQRMRGGPIGALMGGLGALGRGGRVEGKTESAGGKPSGGTVPLALEAFSWLSHEAAQQFVEQISPTTTEYQVIIADGDETSGNLIRAGAYREASLRLREITEGKRVGSVGYKEPKDKAPDYYNLGLAYEAQGPAWFEDSVQAYRRAVEADPETIEHAEGLGRIARLLEGTNLIELQRAPNE